MKRHTIIEQLRRERRAREITQEVVAHLSGYDRVQINQYELGKTSPRLDTISNWADVLGFQLVLQPKEEK
jgi:transcriptional regulator with XRE-family HTH domain